MKIGFKKAVSLLLAVVLVMGLVPFGLVASAAAADPRVIENDSLKIRVGELGQISLMNIQNDQLNRQGNQINFVLPNDTKNQNDTAHQWMGEMIFSTRTSKDGVFPEDNTGFTEVDTNNTLAAGGSTTATNIAANNPYIEQTMDGKKVVTTFIGEDLAAAKSRTMKGFDVTSTFDAETNDGSILWSIELKNKSNEYIEFGDVGLPMPWNNKYANISDTYNNRLTVHSYAGADSGYMYAIRCSGEGNYMMFTPVPDSGARIEYVDYWIGNSGVKDYRGDSQYKNWVGDGGGWYPGLSVLYVHSKDIYAKTGRSYLAEEPTSLVLKPGESKTYQFKFSAVRAGDNDPQESNESYNNASASIEERENNMRSILYRSGMIDAVAVPSFQTAINMETKLDLHYDENLISDVKVEIKCVHENDPYDEKHIPNQSKGMVNNNRAERGLHDGNPQYTEACNYVETKVVNGESHHIYNLQFGCIGNNSVCVSYKLKMGDQYVDKYTQFEFNALAELDEIANTHSNFMVENTQDVDPASKTYGIYHDWYLSSGINDSHWGDDWSHDNINFMAMKNYLDPDADEVRSIETYLIDFMWNNYMKYTQDSFTVANYLSASGINTTSGSPYTRTFSEVMEATGFFNMYRIEKAYPDLIDYREPATFYLEKAYGIYVNRVGTGSTGFYGEQQIPDMIEALRAEGMTAEADNLQNRFAQRKGTSVANAAYPYGSEFEYDNTGEEGAYSAAKALRTYYPENAKAEAALAGMSMANMKTRAMRGLQPTWYFYADPVFRGGEGWWNFQYTASLAGYIMDDWLRYEADEEVDSSAWAERLSYAAKLSNFNAVNMGQISDKSVGSVAWRFNAHKGGFGTKNVNDGGTRVMNNGWQDFAGESDEGIYGSLLTISSDVATDPVFGLFGYGCSVTKNNGVYSITPKDGMGRRVNVIDEKIFVETVQDAISLAKIAADGSSIELNLDCTSAATHLTEVEISGAGLKEGFYTATVNGTQAGQIYVSGHAGKLTVVVPDGESAVVKLTADASAVNTAPVVSVKVEEDDLQAIVPFTIKSTAYDDGAPSGSLTYAWTVVSKPENAEMILSATNIPTITAKGTASGEYVVRLNVSDGELVSSAELTLTLAAAPGREEPTIVAATGEQDLTNPAVADLNVQAEADQLYEGELTYKWEVVSQPDDGNAVIGNASQSSAKLLASKPGEYVLKVVVTDADVHSEAQVVVVMNEHADGVQRSRTIVTKVGEAPVLPAEISLICPDGTISSAEVTWEPVAEEQYNRTGTFEVAGRAEDVEVAAACPVLVIAGERMNIAPMATPTAIINTPSDLGGVAGLNDGYEPTSSRDTSHGVWHNWHGAQGDPAWVKYTWENPVTIDGSDAYYFTDGNFAPKTVYYEYLDANGKWQMVPNAEGLGVVLNQYNTTTFDPITTTAIRMTMTPKTLGCGVIEWKVYGYVDSSHMVDTSELEALVNSSNALLAKQKKGLILDDEGVLAAMLDEAKECLSTMKGLSAADDDELAEWQAMYAEALKNLSNAIASLKAKDDNLAFLATSTNTYCPSWESGDAMNDGIINVGVDPAKPRYGTWGNNSEFEEVTYTWPVSVKIDSAKIQFWTDEGGILAPKAYEYYTLNAEGEYELVLRSDGTVKGAHPVDILLESALDARETTSLKVRIYKQKKDSNGIGVMEWQVFGKLPEVDQECHHDLAKVEAKDATCTEAGNDEYWICQVETCGKLFADAEGKIELAEIPVIDALGHIPGDWIIDQDATATEDGSKHKECTVCHEVLETESIPATGEKLENVVVKAVVDGDKTGAQTIWTGKAPKGTNLMEFLNENVVVEERAGYTMDKWYNWDWYGHKHTDQTTVNGWTNVYVTYTKMENVVVRAVVNGDKANAEIIWQGKAPKGVNLVEFLNENAVVEERVGYVMDQWYNWDWYGHKHTDKTTVNGWTNVYVTFNKLYNVVVKAVVDGDKAGAKVVWQGQAPHCANLVEFLNENAKDEINVPRGYTMDQWYNWDWYGHKHTDAVTVGGWTNVYVTFSSN